MLYDFLLLPTRSIVVHIPSILQAVQVATWQPYRSSLLQSDNEDPQKCICGSGSAFMALKSMVASLSVSTSPIRALPPASNRTTISPWSIQPNPFPPARLQDKRERVENGLTHCHP